MKLKLDENLGELGREMLTAQGHDVSSVAMQGMSGSQDAALYQVCRSEGRVLITLDRDFGEVLRFPPEDTPGIAVLLPGQAVSNHDSWANEESCRHAPAPVDRRSALDCRSQQGARA